ncbi:MAG TPA: urate hydroxylase PuuD [Gaiellaceae bacterium]|nr:urate hydroxylase PuuD [Gaiellaceae bacterium]
MIADAYLYDWADLLLRWLHVIAGIAWIGSSFYFIALDNHLRPRGDNRDKTVLGDAWEVHGGGFYRVTKYKVAPETLPEPLHWFKWEAYTTWLSGFALLVVLYYLDADTYLVDRSVADLSAGEAAAISIGLIALAWFAYDGLCRLLAGRELLLALAVLGFVAASAYATSELFAPRALPIQLGAMIGTMMVGNVFFVIIPGHWELVRAKQAGREPDARHGIRGKQRSVHNNYLTLPVVLAMIAPHFAFVYGHPRAWLALLALMVIGAWVRHFFNLHHAGRDVWAIPVTAAIAVVALAFAIRPDDGAPAQPVAGGEEVEFEQVAAIVEQRCATCHSTSPTDDSFTAAPAGVVLDTEDQIRAQANAIEEQAVRTRAMPLGNKTGMTEDERALLGRWVQSLP